MYGSECWALSRVDARKVDALDQWCLRRILDIRWYHRVSNCEVRRLTEQPHLTSIIQKRRLTLFGHLVRMDESTDARRILTAVPQSEWRRPVGRPYTSWMATLKNDLARHNLTLEDVIELALNKPLWRLLAASGATHWWCMPNNDDDDDMQHSIEQYSVHDISLCNVYLCTGIWGQKVTKRQSLWLSIKQKQMCFQPCPRTSKVTYQSQFSRQLVPEPWTGDVERPVTKLGPDSRQDILV